MTADERSSKEEQVGAKKTEKNASNNQSISVPSSPPVINEIKTGNLQFNGNNEKAYGDHHLFNNPEWWLVFATAVLVYVTARLVSFTKKLWRSTGDLVKGAEETAQRQLRAYVFGKGFAYGQNTTNNEVTEYVFWVPIQNNGLTPADEVRVQIEVAVFHMIENREPNFIAQNNPTFKVLSPHGHTKSIVTRITTNAMSRAFRNEYDIYIWSRIEYTDVFHPGVTRHHEQCARMNIIRDPTLIPPAGHAPIIEFLSYGPQNGFS